MAQPHTVVIGAGPAGLTAAYELTRRHAPVEVVEADDVVGGISRTVERDGWRFDIGGHRFFTKVPRVEAFWHEILSDERLPAAPPDEPHPLPGPALRLPAAGRQRAAQPGRAGGGPLRRVVPVGAGAAAGRPEPLRGLGRRPASAGGSTGSSSRRTPRRSGAFPPTELQADWAAQRIQNLSLGRGDPSTRCCPSAAARTDQPDRGVPLPPARPGDDVGALRRTGGQGRRDGRAGDSRSAPCTARTAGRSR